MEVAARRYARWVLIIHLVLLVAVVTIVYFAARDIYFTQRRQAILQASEVQGLLARQTARGISEYYSSIVDSLQVFRRAGADESILDQINRAPAPNSLATTQLLAPAMWQQLRNRADVFMLFDHTTGAPVWIYPIGKAEVGRKIVEQTREWLAPLTRAGISPVYKLPGNDNVNLVAVPTGPGVRYFMVAVVPLGNIDRQLLQEVHSRAEMSALLLDENMRVMTAYDKSIVGLSIASEGSSTKVKQVAEKYIRTGTAGTEVFEAGFQLGPHHFDRGMVSIEPVTILGNRWWLTIGSNLNVVDAIVHDTFQKTLLWGIFLVVSAGTILFSTAVQMIRSRVRLERVRHEALSRELSQARKIQLAWLPAASDTPKHIDICAVNKPASHISGDFYNWFEMDGGRVCVVIGDVTGHGMAAAFLMSTTQLLVRMIMPGAGTPGKCLEFVNRQLCQQIFNGQFVTMIILVINRDKRTMELATAGHPAPLVGIDGKFRELELEPQLVLGVDRDSTYPTEAVQLSGAASVLLYTDGLVDTISPTDDRFRLDRLKKSLNLLTSTAASSKALTEQIVQSVDSFRAGRPLEDDLTLVSLNVHPTQQPSDLAAAQI